MKRWQRSDYIVLAILVAVVLVASSAAIIVERRHRMSEGMVRNPPWLMWGNSQTLKIDLGSGGLGQIQSQLVRVAYARPEAWRFLFTAELLETDLTGAPASLLVSFDVITGVGRSQVTMKDFELYGWVANTLAPLSGVPKRSTSVYGGDRVNGAATQHPNTIEVIPGQDIQITTRVIVLATGGSHATVRVDAYLTPNVHIRPEWFKGKMGQAEDQGR